MTFGKRLKKALEFRQLKQAELSKASGISQSQISLYMKDKVTPSLPVICKIAQTLSIDINYFLGIVDNIEKTYLEELLGKILLLNPTEIISVLDYVNSMKSIDNNKYIRKETIWRN